MCPSSHREAVTTKKPNGSPQTFRRSSTPMRPVILEFARAALGPRGRTQAVQGAPQPVGAVNRFHGGGSGRGVCPRAIDFGGVSCPSVRDFHHVRCCVLTDDAH